MNERPKIGRGEVAFIVLFFLAFLAGLYIGRYEVDQYPTPRALFNLAGAYYDNFQREKAFELLEVVANYEELYPERPVKSADGSRIDKNSMIVIEAARRNLELKKHQYDDKNDPLIRRGKP